MDEAGQYQQRLQAIAEKRRVQAEEERARRETKEDWLKVVQHQRKSLRDQWLMEPTPSSTEARGPGPTPGSSPPKTEESAEETKIIQTQIKEVEKNKKMNDEQSFDIVKNPISLSDNYMEKHIEANPAEGANDDSGTSENALNPRVLLQNRQLERSVLGDFEQRSEKELKTDTTTMIKASLSAEVPEAPGEVVFDADQQTMHTMQGIKFSLPSEEELKQIHEVGVQDTISSVTLTCNKASCGGQKERKPEVDPSADAAGGPFDLDCDTLQQKKPSEEEDYGSLAENKTEFEMTGGLKEGGGGGAEDRDGGKDGEGEVDVEEEEWEMVDCSPDEGLSDLTFLDFMQAQAHYKDGAALKVEQDCNTDKERLLEVGPSETKSKLKGCPKNEESKCNSVIKPSCLDGSREHMQPKATLETCFDTEVASGTSVPLQVLSNVLGIIVAEQTPENSVEMQKNLPQNPANINSAVEDGKEISVDSSGAITENTEEQETSTARIGAEVEPVGKIVRKELTFRGFEDETFQEVPLEGKREVFQSYTQRETVEQSTEHKPELLAAVSPSETPFRTKDSPKSKTCQCCTVM